MLFQKGVSKCLFPFSHTHGWHPCKNCVPLSAHVIGWRFQRAIERTLCEAEKEVSSQFKYEMTSVKLRGVSSHSQCFPASPCRYSIMKSCWQWSAAERPSPADLVQALQAAMKTSNDRAVLRVPELVVPERYASVAGVDVHSLVMDYTILWGTLSHVGKGEVSELALSRHFASSEWGVYVGRDCFVFQTCYIYQISLSMPETTIIIIIIEATCWYSARGHLGIKWVYDAVENGIRNLS